MLRPYKVKGSLQSQRRPTKSKATAWEAGATVDQRQRLREVPCSKLETGKGRKPVPKRTGFRGGFQRGPHGRAVEGPAVTQYQSNQLLRANACGPSGELRAM